MYERELLALRDQLRVKAEPRADRQYNTGTLTFKNNSNTISPRDSLHTSNTAAFLSKDQ
jgi:hypothetical protein